MHCSACTDLNALHCHRAADVQRWRTSGGKLLLLLAAKSARPSALDVHARVLEQAGLGTCSCQQCANATTLRSPVTAICGVRAVVVVGPHLRCLLPQLLRPLVEAVHHTGQQAHILLQGCTGWGVLQQMLHRAKLRTHDSLNCCSRNFWEMLCPTWGSRHTPLCRAAGTGEGTAPHSCAGNHHRAQVSSRKKRQAGAWSRWPQHALDM